MFVFEEERDVDGYTDGGITKDFHVLPANSRTCHRLPKGQGFWRIQNMRSKLLAYLLCSVPKGKLMMTGILLFLTKGKTIWISSGIPEYGCSPYLQYQYSKTVEIQWCNFITVFPWIVSAETILFWIWPYYSRKYGILKHFWNF